jgi:hypothetical protein
VAHSQHDAIDPKADTQRFPKPHSNPIAVAARLQLGSLRDAESRTKTFTC